MIVDLLRLRGFSPAFPDLVEVPFTALPAGLIAVTGPNGAGKTTLLETTPGGVYRRMPSGDGADPVTYAQVRDAFVELQYHFDDGGTFRSRLNFDALKKRSEAVLERRHPDGRVEILNRDGGVKSYDALIRRYFPSFDLFCNSAFAGQGRGDEFTRRLPTKRKELFVEFLALQHYGAKAKTAAAAAELVQETRVRLQAEADLLARACAPAVAATLAQDEEAHQLARTSAQRQQRLLRAEVTRLEAQAAALADHVATHGAQTQRAAAIGQAVTARRQDRAALATARAAATTTLADEQRRLVNRRDTEVQAAATAIAGNRQIQGLRAQILAAVAALQVVEQQLVAARAAVATAQADRQRVNAALRDVERRLHALGPIGERLQRSLQDAALLDTVPCGGQGAYAGCQFLVNATAARAAIADLQTRLAPAPALEAELAQWTVAATASDTAVDTSTRAVTALQHQQTTHAASAQCAPKLAEATARIEQLEAAQQKARDDAARGLADAQARRDARLRELDAQDTAITQALAHLEGEHAALVAARATTAGAQAEAATVQRALTTARAQWDTVTTALATATSGLLDTARRRQRLTQTRARLGAVQAQLAQVEQELVEWRDLAKALTKLPEIEIDNAGPTISARTNELLGACFGPRFTVELVTQVAKADGAGMKDEFTVRVLDNQGAGDWRDLRQFSGGERTILQEALMCSICLYVNERSPAPLRTLWRDETGAALDAENALAYVQMLRKVREVGALHQILFVTHNPDAADLADARLVVGGGQVRIA